MYIIPEEYILTQHPYLTYSGYESNDKRDGFEEDRKKLLLAGDELVIALTYLDNYCRPAASFTQSTTVSSGDLKHRMEGSHTFNGPYKRICKQRSSNISRADAWISI